MCGGVWGGGGRAPPRNIPRGREICPISFYTDVYFVSPSRLTEFLGKYGVLRAYSPSNSVLSFIYIPNIYLIYIYIYPIYMGILVGLSLSCHALTGIWLSACQGVC